MHLRHPSNRAEIPDKRAWLPCFIARLANERRNTATFSLQFQQVSPCRARSPGKTRQNRGNLSNYTRLAPQSRESGVIARPKLSNYSHLATFRAGNCLTKRAAENGRCEKVQQNQGNCSLARYLLSFAVASGKKDSGCSTRSFSSSSVVMFFVNRYSLNGNCWFSLVR